MASPNRSAPRGLSQPLLGLVGLPFVILAVVALGFFPSKPAALTTTITAITFGLPVLIVATLWWNGWPFARLARGAAGWARFLFLVVATLVITAIGQAVTGALDIGGIVGVAGSFGIFPYGFVLAACVFLVTLQLTFVTQKVPFHKLKPVASGIAVFVTSWILGLAQYFFLLNWSEAPGRPPAPPFGGIGPIYALDWPAILICILILQMVFFLLLRGYPFSGIRQPVVAFIIVNVFTIAGGFLLHWLFRLAGLNDPQISGLGAAVAAAVILLVILFDGWPLQNAENALGRIARVIVVVVLTIGLYALLVAVGSIGYPTAPGTPPVELWVAGVCLNLIAAFAIVHVAVFGRWPLPVKPADPDHDGEIVDQAKPGVERA